MHDAFLRLGLWITNKRGCGWFGRSTGTGFNPPITKIGWLITGGLLALVLLTFAMPVAVAWPLRIGAAVSLFAINWWTALPPS